MIVCVQFPNKNGLDFSRWSIYSVDPRATHFHLLDEIILCIYLFFILSTVLPDYSLMFKAFV